MEVRKKIRLTYPFTGAQGQYTWWANDFLGVKSGAQLYSVVKDNPLNQQYIQNHPYDGGISWLYKGSKISVLGTNVKNRGVNYSTKRSGQCVYMIDPQSDSEISSANTGNDIRSVLGDGNPSGADHCGGPYILVRKYDGHVGSGNNLGSVPAFSGYVEDFPSTPISSDPKGYYDYDGGDYWLMEKSLPRWYEKTDGTAFTFVVRMTGNADDWDTQDYRNRSYRKYSLPKDILTDMFIQSNYYENSYNSMSYENLCWGDIQVGESLNGHTCTRRVGGNGSFYEDDYGTGDESPSWRDVTVPAYDNKAFMVRVTPPTWNWNDIPAYTPNHNDPNPDSGELGWLWVVEGDEDEMLNLNPYQRIDYVGLDTNVGGYCTLANTDTLTNETCYSDESCNNFHNGAECIQVKRQFYESDVLDYRPITFITSNYRNDGKQELKDPDLQAITLSGEEYPYITAPLTVNFSLRFAENRSSFTPEWIAYDGDDPNGEFADNHGIITDNQVREFGGTKFIFYVVDWDTQLIPNADVDETEIESWDDYINIAPSNWQELAALRDRQNTFVYQTLWDNEPNEDGSYNYNTLTHQYNEPGIKYITAVVYSYINHSQNGSENGIPYKDHIQSLRWKLIKAKIYIGLDNAYVEDFTDIVGKDYKLLPYPYTVPVIGGLSEKSQYVRSLSKITDENLFQEDDILERNKLEMAYDKSPLGESSEFGSHLGRADISQVRYFEGPDIGYCSQGSQKQIGMDMVDMSGVSCRRDEFCGGGEYGGFDCEVEGCGVCVGAQTYDMNYLLMLSNMWYCPVEYNVAREFVKNSKLTSDKFNYSDIKESYTSESKCNEFCNYFSINCLQVYPDEFHNFNDWQYWYSYPDEDKNLPDNQNFPRYTRDSCVGRLFINDTSNIMLKKKATIEMNMSNKEHQMFHKDPKGAKGILLGDFLVNKPGVDEKVLRENLMEEPKTNKSDKAF